MSLPALRFLVGLALAARMSAGEPAKTVYAKSLDAATKVEIIEQTEYLGDHSSGPRTMPANSAKPVPPEVAARFVPWPGKVNLPPRRQLLRTYDVFLVETESGKRTLLIKYVGSPEPIIFYDGDPPRVRLPRFSVHDAASDGASLYLLMAGRPTVRLDRIHLSDAGQPAESETSVILFAEEDNPPFWPIKSASVIPGKNAAYVFFVSESGKDALWEVKDGKAKQVWITDIAPPKKPANTGHEQEPPPEKPQTRLIRANQGTQY